MNRYANQERWNRTKGAANLSRVKENPSAFLVDPSTLSSIKTDLIRSIPQIEGARILEFGSGRGELSVALAKLGARVMGVDLGMDLIALSRMVADVNGVSCTFLVGDVTRLPLRDCAFDFVVGTAILHHLPPAGVRASLAEAHRLLRPGGLALFAEPIENSRVFDGIQKLIPAGRPGTAHYRPSILQRSAYTRFLTEADDRALSDAELRQAGGQFREIDLRYYGLLIRLARISDGPRIGDLLRRVDSLLTHAASPVKQLGQQVLAVYKK